MRDKARKQICHVAIVIVCLSARTFGRVPDDTSLRFSAAIFERPNDLLIERRGKDI